MMKKIQNKFNLDNDLPLKKTLELYDIVIVVWSIFHEGNKYYPQVFLDECLDKKWQKSKRKISRCKKKIERKTKKKDINVDNIVISELIKTKNNYW